MRMLSVALAVATLPAPALSIQGAPARDGAAEYSARLSKLNELQRFATLRRVVATSGFACRRVAAARPSGRYRNLVMWSVRCTPGGDYGLFIGPDSSVQVRQCAQLARLKLPACALPPATR